MIVGTATLMFVFVLISGIVIWWPRTKGFEEQFEDCFR